MRPCPLTSATTFSSTTAHKETARSKARGPVTQVKLGEVTTCFACTTSFRAPQQLRLSMQIDFPLSPKARKSGTGWIDVCPAHNDRSPSLSVNVGADGKLLLHCFAGCSFDSIISAAGLTGSKAYRSVTRSDLEAIQEQQRQEDVRRAAYCRKLWKQGQPIEGTLSQSLSDVSAYGSK